MTTKFWAGVLAAVLAFSPVARAQQEPGPLSVDLAITYTAERAKIASTACGCFWLHGGSVNGGVSLFRGLGVAANLTGEYGSNIASGLNLGKVAFMAGPRYTLGTSRWSERFLHGKHGTSVFGEALFGFAHGFDSLFPTSTGITSSATSFSMQVGGGLNIALARNFGLRALEIDYVRTTLPNSVGNIQNDLRLAIGLSYRLHAH
jgi:hypothetical protein